jgi:hypothetical protein
MDLGSGRYLVRKARDAILAHLQGGPAPKVEGFHEKQGVFVTLETYPDKGLRGCIGFPEPVMPLGKAVVDAAVFAAVDDPRFPPVTKEELGRLLVEMSVLTPPQRMECAPDKRPAKILIGRDGLIARCKGGGGLLLPQVPVEWGWDAKTFIGQTCIKAGLPSDAWKRKDVEFYTFRAEIFSEETPGGKVVKKKEE